MYWYVFINLPSINIGMCEENSVKNFLFFIQAGAGLSNRHRPKCPNSGSATLAMESNFSHFLFFNNLDLDPYSDTKN